jgi:hypothetical protein
MNYYRNLSLEYSTCCSFKLFVGTVFLSAGLPTGKNGEVTGRVCKILVLRFIYVVFLLSSFRYIDPSLQIAWYFDLDAFDHHRVLCGVWADHVS